MAREKVLVESKGDRGPAKNIVIAITDGISTVKRNQVGVEADLLRNQSQADVYLVAIGKYIDQGELSVIAGDLSRNIIQVDDFNLLEYITRLLVHRVCNVPDPTPTCNQTVDLALIVDNSGSVKDNYMELKQFLANVIERFDVGPNKNRVAVVRFSDIAELDFRLD